ncbi:MAG: hypothetical protein ACW99U_10270 [Candidatus Thorarchaeota archaeon]
MKRRAFVIGTSVFAIVNLLLLALTPIPAQAAIVWSDNFDDGNYDGWTMCENPGFPFNASNWSAANNYLQIDQEDWGLISYPSNVAYGTWSFDFKFNETEVERRKFQMRIFFISNDINNVTSVGDNDDLSCYYFDFNVLTTSSTDFYLSLEKWHGAFNTIIDQYNTPVPVAGWHHIDVTRNTTGWFSVYHNGSLVLQGLDTELTTSELFVLSFEDWQIIDNIVVRDDIPETTTTTPPPPPADIPMEFIALGIAVPVVIIVVVVGLRMRRP